jgi:ankyrin repeat protein
MKGFFNMIDLNEEFLKRCKEGFWDKAVSLLDQGADVNAIDTDGKSAFQYALDSGFTEIIGLVWSRGARSNMLGINFSKKEI